MEMQVKEVTTIEVEKVTLVLDIEEALTVYKLLNLSDNTVKRDLAPEQTMCKHRLWQTMRQVGFDTKGYKCNDDYLSF